MRSKLFLLKQVIFLLLLLLLPVVLFPQPTGDSISIKPIVELTPEIMYQQSLQQLLKDNIFLNSFSSPVATFNQEKKTLAVDLIFYILLGTILFLSFLRFFYERYFNNLFRVFFNTSLRQSQLTDQLLQAKLASMLFNLFFAITGGLYINSLLNYFGWITASNTLLSIVASVLILAFIYFLKFLTLKFTGWLTGNKEVANTYLFIIFLINKILSVLLIPFIVVISFSTPVIKTTAVMLSLLLISLMFLLRFLRSFRLLKNQIKVGWFHFLLFIIGIELLPILLIYKGLVVLLNKNL